MNRKDRTQQILELVARGRSLKEIACDLNLSRRGVVYWMGKIYSELSVSTRSHGELISIGFRRGLLK